MESPYENVEGAARYVLEQFEVPYTDPRQDDVEELLDNIRNGKCQTCHQELGKDTTLIVSRAGPVGAYCSGPCLQDQAILAWMTESFGDVQDRIAFRASEGAADEPEDEQGV